MNIQRGLSIHEKTRVQKSPATVPLPSSAGGATPFQGEGEVGLFWKKNKGKRKNIFALSQDIAASEILIWKTNSLWQARNLFIDA